jgi:long-chain acyl-CoA synthetase
LAAAGIGPGDRIVLRAASSPEWVGLLLGAMLRGAVLVPLDVDAADEQLARIADEVEAKCVLRGDDELFALFRAPTADAGAPVAPVGPNEAALIYFTSGTTSRPRGVVLTHGNLMAQLERFRPWRGLVRLVPFRLMMIAPLSHIQGMVVGLCVPLWLGLGVIYTHSVHPAHLIRSLRGDRVTLLASVPRVLHSLGKALRQRPYGGRGATVDDKLRRASRRFLRRHYLFRAARHAFGYRFWVIFVGGAPLPREDEQLWRDTGCFVMQGYGLTETAAIVSVNSPLFSPLGSIGRPLRHQEVRLADDGEILVRGASVTPGYFQDPAANEQSFQDGFLRTGDLAFRDHRDRLFFRGRKKEVIVTGEGFNVYPEDVESRLNQAPGVIDSVVIGIDRQGHAEVHAVLLLQTGASEAEIVAGANRHLQPYQRIRSWTVWPAPDFPRTSLLKPRRDEISNTVAGRRRHSAGEHLPEPTLEEIRMTEDRGRRLDLLVRHLLCREGSGPSGQLGDTLSLVGDLGLSSLDVVELLARLEANVEISLDSATVATGTTVADVRELLRSDRGTPQPPRLPSGPPAWWSTRAGDGVRALVRPALAGAWATLAARIRVRWNAPPPAPPWVIAAAPHRHWLDVLAIHSALPRLLRSRLAFVTERDFHECFDPAPGTPAKVRLGFAAAYYLGLPAAFRFAVVPSFGSTREGLRAACRLVEQGYSPITFPKGFFFDPLDAARHDLGATRIAVECGVPILPVWIAGNEHLRMWPRRDRPEVTVHCGEALPVFPDLSLQRLAADVEAAFANLAATAL